MTPDTTTGADEHKTFEGRAKWRYFSFRLFTTM
jgi:hypothetical protein